MWALSPQALEHASLPEAVESVARRWTEEEEEEAKVVVTGRPSRLHPSSSLTFHVLRVAERIPTFPQSAHIDLSV